MGVWLIEQTFSGSCKKLFLWRGATMEAFHCDENMAQDMKCVNRSRRTRGRPETAMQNKTDGMPSGFCLWGGLALSLMRVKKKFVLNASTISMEDCMGELLHMMNFGMASGLGRERALKMWQAFRTWLGDPKANILCLSNLSSDSMKTFLLYAVNLHYGREVSFILKIFRALKIFVRS